MKTVMKNLLLGSVAGLAMVGTAAAADLPVKAKAAEYVKVCSTYGAGFYYIPGTDTCLKVGGYIKADFYVQRVKFDYGTEDYDHSDTESYFATRAALQLDARTQTEYGTLRSYIEARWTYSRAYDAPYSTGISGNNVQLKYAYIQFAGFTFGKATSAFDFWAGDFYEGIDPGFFYSDYTPNQIAYTADFGNGFSATISLEDAYERSGNYTDVYDNDIGQQVPDIVANLTYEGTWGAAKLAGALHDLSQEPVGQDASDDFGWAVLAGVKFDFAETTTLYLKGVYSQGAIGYTGLGAAFSLYDVNAYGDSVDAWYVGGGIRHYWTPTVFTSFVGSYGQADDVYFSGDDYEAYSLAVNIGWQPVKGLTLVLQYDRIEEQLDYGFDIPDDKVTSDRFMFEAARKF
ncbi:porin [Bosea sp. 117]|uniref:porin n=1 Tax=Bosea sp. 117 TaxID=1125973 RepID=UPI000691A9F9|nr:porin [Bosea sp. 117]